MSEAFEIYKHKLKIWQDNPKPTMLNKSRLLKSWYQFRAEFIIYQIINP